MREGIMVSNSQLRPRLLSMDPGSHTCRHALLSSVFSRITLASLVRRSPNNIVILGALSTRSKHDTTFLLTQIHKGTWERHNSNWPTPTWSKKCLACCGSFGRYITYSLEHVRCLLSLSPFRQCIAGVLRRAPASRGEHQASKSPI
jgi:hypothetical protein